MRTPLALNMIAPTAASGISIMLMSSFPMVSPGELVPSYSRVAGNEHRSFGRVETGAPAIYTGPYGVLLDESSSQIISVATDSANHCQVLIPVG